jgi:hypothetical protein
VEDELCSSSACCCVSSRFAPADHVQAAAKSFSFYETAANDEMKQGTEQRGRESRKAGEDIVVGIIYAWYPADRFRVADKEPTVPPG